MSNKEEFPREKSLKVNFLLITLHAHCLYSFNCGVKQRFYSFLPVATFEIEVVTDRAESRYSLVISVTLKPTTVRSMSALQPV